MSPERLKIPKIGKLIDREQFLLRYTKSTCELWSTNYRDLYVSMDPLKCTFWDIIIFRPLGGAAPWNFYTRYRLSKPCWRTRELGKGSPPKKYNREKLKFGLKFSVWAPVTSGLVEVSSQNVFLATCRDAGVIKWVQVFEGPPPKIWEREKNVQNSSMRFSGSTGLMVQLSVTLSDPNPIQGHSIV